MALGLGMQHSGHGPNNIYKKDDIRLILAIVYLKVKYFYINSYKQNFKNLLVWD